MLDVFFWGLKASLWRPRDKYIAIFDKKKYITVFSAKIFSVFGHQNPGSGSVFSLKCWIRIPGSWSNEYGSVTLPETVETFSLPWIHRGKEARIPPWWCPPWGEPGQKVGMCPTATCPWKSKQIFQKQVDLVLNPAGELCLTYKQCSGFGSESGSTGSTCFWVSWIRNRIQGMDPDPALHLDPSIIKQK